MNITLAIHIVKSAQSDRTSILALSVALAQKRGEDRLVSCRFVVDARIVYEDRLLGSAVLAGCVLSVNDTVRRRPTTWCRGRIPDS